MNRTVDVSYEVYDVSTRVSTIYEKKNNCITKTVFINGVNGAIFISEDEITNKEFKTVRKKHKKYKLMTPSIRPPRPIHQFKNRRHQD